LPSSPDELLREWPSLLNASLDLSQATPFNESDLLAPSPAPRQVFAIGLNFQKHAEESGMGIPSIPATFTKFPSSLTGPFAPVPISSETVDWEVELVVVIGKTASKVAEVTAWDYVAGLMVGQDYSDRHVQFAAGSQFSLGKSYYGFGPTGPWITTLDEIENPDNLRLGCSLNGVVVQDDYTSDMIFPVARLIAELSQVTPLLPGDLIFTGTPSGCGIFQQPPRFLRDGDILESFVEGLGTIRNNAVKEA